ncbi:hypothetical protein DNF23_31715 [Pseudomonas syringae pv. pisi]
MPCWYHREQGKPDSLPIPEHRDRQVTRREKILREALGEAGMGGWKKRTPACNGTDRDSRFVPT